MDWASFVNRITVKYEVYEEKEAYIFSKVFSRWIWCIIYYVISLSSSFSCSSDSSSYCVALFSINMRIIALSYCFLLWSIWLSFLGSLLFSGEEMDGEWILRRGKVWGSWEKWMIGKLWSGCVDGVSVLLSSCNH